MKQAELQKIAEKCGLNGKFEWGEQCPECLYFGDDDPLPCCAFCTKYDNCKSGQEIAETRCKREYEETAKRKKVPTPA